MVLSKFGGRGMKTADGSIKERQSRDAQKSAELLVMQ